ncbi:stage V sporulation protein AA [Alkalibacillus flavidus]|uniref:Stage V sporulation protein AA n=1 Tax=Alkalibacillus flavidus TaxID=546021 RepID=A0ABV2KS19_9BACI
MAEVVYIRLKPKISVKTGDHIRLGDMAWICCADCWQDKLLTLFIHDVQSTDHTYKVIDIYHVIEKLKHLYPDVEVETVGASQTVLALEQRKPTLYPLYIFFVWTLLFIGAAMAVMNFHYDVSMPDVQAHLHDMMARDVDRSVLWLQIPYSIGLGLGMVLFFNHFFKKKFNEEPSPLEVEMFNYDQNLYQYVTFNENELNRDDH